MEIGASITVPVIIHGQEKVVPVTDLPVITIATKEVFEELGYFGPDLLTHPMQKKAQTLATLIQRAQDQQPYTAKDRLLCLLRAVGNVAVVAAGVLCAVFSPWPTLGILGLFVGVITGIGCGIYNMSRLMNTREKMRSSEFLPLVGLLAGPFCAIYEAFRAPPYFDDSIAKKTEKMTQHIAVLSHYFQKTDTPKLREAIEQKVQEAKAMETELNSLPIQLTNGQKQLIEVKERYESALSQLDQAVAFYKQ